MTKRIEPQDFKKAQHLARMYIRASIVHLRNAMVDGDTERVAKYTEEVRRAWRSRHSGRSRFGIPL